MKHTLTLALWTLLTISTTSALRRSCKFDSVRVLDRYVDKSDLINTFFNDLPESRAIFVGAAHGFGKTVNLDLIDMFANTEFDMSRRELLPEESYSYSIFKEGLKASQYESTISEHLGKYLVVPLRIREFRQEELIIKHIRWNLNMMIGWSNRRFRWVGFSTKNFTSDNETSQRDFSFFQKITRTKIATKDLTSALDTYVEILHRYFNKKIIILVDDYDRIFRHAIQYTMKNVDVYYALLNEILSKAIANTERVHKILITGTSSLPLYLRNVTLAQIDKYNFLRDHIFTSSYGINDQELEELFQLNNQPIEEKDNLQKLADGYKTLTHRTTLYRTDTVMAYFRRGRNQTDDEIFNSTAAQRRSDEDELYFPVPFLMVPQFRYKVIELIHKFDVEFTLLEYTAEHFQKFADFSVYEYESPEFSMDLLFTYIFDQGYLGLTDEPNKYVLPNTLALNDTWTALKSYYNDIGKPTLDTIASNFYKILLSENSTQIDTFKEELQTIMTSVFTQLTIQEYFQQAKVPRNQFHSIIYAAIASSEELKLAENELEMLPKSYIQFTSPATSCKGIMEIKYKESAEQALELALSSFITDQQLTEVKYFGINIDENYNATILIQLKPIQEQEQSPYRK